MELPPVEHQADQFSSGNNNVNHEFDNIVGHPDFADIADPSYVAEASQEVSAEIAANERMVAMVGLMMMVGNLARSNNPEHRATGLGVMQTIAETTAVTQSDAYAEYLHLQQMQEVNTRQLIEDEDGIDPLTGKPKKKKINNSVRSASPSLSKRKSSTY